MARPKRILLEQTENESTETEFLQEKVNEGELETEVEMVDVTIPTQSIKVESPIISDNASATPPICELQGLSQEEMKLVISSRIKAIIGKTQIPYIPAFITYRDSDSTSAPPLNAIVDNVDHIYLTEAWDFYRANAPSPNAVEFLELVRMATRTPERVFTRVAPISLM